MFDELKAVLDRMLDEGRSVSIFFRDDDVGRLDESLERFLHLFAAREVPLNLAVVPAWIASVGTGVHFDTAEKLHRLLDLKNRWPELLCYHQHGFRHVNHAVSGKRSEFPPDRPYEKQLTDIKEGMEILTEELGDAFFPAFTPPWNRCSPATLDALATLGFKMISGDAPMPGASRRGLVDMPVTLDILERTAGEDWRCRKPGAAMADLIEQLGSQERVGIMLHHQSMGRECLDFLDGLLEVIGGHPAVRVGLFEGLAGQKSG